MKRGGWFFVHDVGGDFDGLCATYKSVDEWRKRAAEYDAKNLPLPHGAAFDFEDPMPLTKLVYELGEKRNTHKRVVFPMMYGIDETALLASSSSHVDKTDLKLMVRRAHVGVAPVYNMQDPTLLHPRFVSMTTDVYVFRQPSVKAIAHLQERMGAPPGAFDSMLNAPKHRYIHFKRGEGFA